jgi:hypothetical protein
VKAWTDYPIVELGDREGFPAPVRECNVLSWDGDKYCDVIVDGVNTQFKCAYIYQIAGRHGEVPRISSRQLALLREVLR